MAQGNLDTFDKKGNEALDHLFEIEIAGLLARRDDVAVEMAEPDIVYRVGVRSPPVGLACKRPKTLDAFDRAMRTAGHQLETRTDPGVILIDISLLLLPAKEQAKAMSFETDDQAQAAFNGRIQEILLAADRRRENVLGKGVAGVLYTGTAIYIDRRSVSTPRRTQDFARLRAVLFSPIRRRPPATLNSENGRRGIRRLTRRQLVDSPRRRPWGRRAGPTARPLPSL